MLSKLESYTIQHKGEPMRISELSAETGVPVPTIKYYLREGLLPEGRQTAPRQADYSHAHVSRLRLIRALLGPGRLSIATAAEVLRHMDHPPESEHELLGAVHHVLGEGARPRLPEQQPEEHPRADELLASWGWQVDAGSHHLRRQLEEALAGLADAGFDLPPGFLDMYASAMRELATREVSGVPQEAPEEALRYVVLGTVLVEPLLLALRRLAQQDVSARLFTEPAAGASEAQ